MPGNFNPYPWVEWSDFALLGRRRALGRAALPGARAPEPRAAGRRRRHRAAVARRRRAHRRGAAAGAAAGALSRRGDRRRHARAERARRRLRAPLGRLQGEGAADGDDAARARHRRQPRAGQHRAPRRHRPRPAQRRLVRPRRSRACASTAPTGGSTRRARRSRARWRRCRSPTTRGRWCSTAAATALAAMPANTVAAHSREVQIDVDSRAGFDQPVQVDVRTTYRGFSADMMRDDLGDGERAELQRRYLNFYAGSYRGHPGGRAVRGQPTTRAPTRSSSPSTTPSRTSGRADAQGRAPGRVPRARDRQRAEGARRADPHDAAVAARPAVGARGGARATAAGLARSPVRPAR